MTSQIAIAGGQPSWTATITPSIASVNADGHSVITLTVHAITYYCSSPPASGPISYPNPSQCAANGYGTGDPASPASFNYIDLAVAGVGTLANSEVEADSNGNAVTTIQSTSVGSSIVTAYWTTDHSTPRGSTSVSFTPIPAVTTPNPAATLKPQPKTSSTTPNPTLTPAHSNSPSTPASTVKPTITSAPSATHNRSTLVRSNTNKPAIAALAAILVIVMILVALAKMKQIRLPFIR